jgi:Arc-like DNA binding domain
VARRSKKQRKRRVSPRAREARDIVSVVGVVTPHGAPPSTGSTPMPPPSAGNARPRPLKETVQLKLRFSESLRRQLEHAAAENSRSMNAEIIKRLETSFLAPEQITRLVADALLKGLDPDIVGAMGDTIIEEWKSDQAAESYDWHEHEPDFPSREEK